MARFPQESLELRYFSYSAYTIAQDETADRLGAKKSPTTTVFCARSDSPSPSREDRFKDTRRIQKKHQTLENTLPSRRRKLEIGSMIRTTPITLIDPTLLIQQRSFCESFSEPLFRISCSLHSNANSLTKRGKMRINGPGRLILRAFSSEARSCVPQQPVFRKLKEHPPVEIPVQTVHLLERLSLVRFGEAEAITRLEEAVKFAQVRCSNSWFVDRCNAVPSGSKRLTRRDSILGNF